jgi:hypothetical protein
MSALAVDRETIRLFWVISSAKAALLSGLRNHSPVMNLVTDRFPKSGLGGALMPCDRSVDPMV